MAEYVINNFIYGQLSKKMRGRTDLALYKSGLNILRNFLIYPQSGAIVRFPGTWFVSSAINGNSRLFDFVATDGTGFLIEINGSTVVIRDMSGVTKATIDLTSLPTPINYSAEHLAEVDYAYMLNQIYFVHREYEVLKITYAPSTGAFTASIPNFNPTGGSSYNKAGGSNAFSGAGNRPGVVTFKDGRLVLGSNGNYPNVYWMGVVYDSTGYGFDDFEIPSTLTDSSPIEIVLAENRGSIIRAIESSRGLTIITDTTAIEVFYTDGVSFSPLSVPTQRVRSAYGGKQSLSTRYNNSIVFVQRGGIKLRMAVIATDNDIYESPDLTAYNDEILSEGAKYIAVQTVPFEVLYVVTADGKIAALSLSSTANGLIPGFSSIETDGKYKSIVVINAVDREYVWVLVERDNGTYIERLGDISYNENTYMYLDSAVMWEAPDAESASLAPDASGELVVTLGTGTTLGAGDYIKIDGTDVNDLDGWFFRLDPSGTAPNFKIYDAITGNVVKDTYSGPCTVREARNSLTTLGHLEGEDVGVVVDQSAVGNETVSSGKIETDVFGCKIVAGLNNYSKAQPLDVGVLKSRFKITPRVVIELIDSKGGYIGVGGSTYLLPNQEMFNLDEPFPLYSGIIETAVSGSYDFSGSVIIQQDEPYPMSVVSLIQLVDISGYGGK